MGLSTSLNNAVSGLRVNQDSLDILSRNIANQGTPGYHRQSLNIVDYTSDGGSYARTAGATRAFNASLQTYYTRQVSDTANVGVQAGYLDRLQGFLGKPGSAGSLDTVFGKLQTALQGIATSPDDYTARAGALSSAQSMVETLNRLSSTVQGLRQETEGQMAASVNELNGMLTSLNQVNNRMLDLGITDTSRAALLDQRDRLVSSVAEMVDVQATYRSDGSVSLMTRSGVGLLDNGASVFNFESAGNLSAASSFAPTAGESKVGRLTLTTPSGVTLDLVGQGVIQGGELSGLITLRDKTLVQAQSQLDEIAAGLAQAFSTVKTPGTAATAGASTGFDLDITNVQRGNDIQFTYSESGVDKRVRVVNSIEPTDYMDASGQRVIGVDLSDPAAAAALLSTKMPNLAITSTGAGNLRILDDGAADLIDIKTAVARPTSTALQGAGLGFNLFVDQGSKAFTNNLDTDPPQKQGFASRIAINPAVLADNRLMVQSTAGKTLGDADRANAVIAQLKDMNFVSGGSPQQNDGKFQLNGNMSQLIGQVVGFQGATVSTALSQRDDKQLTLDTLVDQMGSEYGVKVDDEMARLMELQNAYAANARVVSVVKELLDALFAAT